MNEHRAGPIRSAAAREAILAATAKMFQAQGYDQLTIEGIAKEAGVGKQTIYRHWGSRARLVHAAISCMPDAADTPDTGLLRDDQVAEVASFVMPEGPYDTLGGLVMQRLGRLPRKGDAVEVDGWGLAVLEVDGRRVDRVQLTAPRPAAADQQQETPA